MSVKPLIDLSAYLGEVRLQHNRPTCLAFALSELHRHGSKLSAQLSPEYLYRAAANLMPDWEPDLGLELSAGLTALSAPGQPHEADCPYQQSEPKEKPPQVPPAAKTMHATNASAAQVDLAKLIQSVAGGKPIGLVLQLTDTFLDPQSGIVEYSDVVVSPQNHAVIAAGLGEHLATNEPHFLVRNTWGKDWGKAGSAWVPAKYITKFALATFEVH